MELFLKRTALYTALLVLTLPVSVHALGLGEIKVKSALDQPFLAEIDLIDVQSAPMTSIRVGLANQKTFEHLGIIPADALSLLSFDVKKNERGRFVVRIYSTERISDPYIQLVLDLTWPKGQIYKTYTVLLDPPGYKLAAATVQSMTYKRKTLAQHQHSQPEITAAASNDSSGPTVSNESVWQIAQRYKTSEVILPQIVLAIVGQNPDAFTDGNLNGLKAGVKLKIPVVSEMVKVPADLATVEVMAHDKAWNEKTAIDHVLAPPYTDGKTSTVSPVVAYSKIPPAPQFSPNTAFTAPVLPYLTPETVNTPVSAEQNATLKAEISITSAAIESLRDSNAMLIEQLHLMQVENKKLHQQLESRDKEIALVHNKIKVMQKEHMAIAGQANTSMGESDSSVGLLLWLLAAAVGGFFAFRYFKHRDENLKEAAEDNSSTETDSEATVAQSISLISPIVEPILQEQEQEQEQETSIVGEVISLPVDAIETAPISEDTTEYQFDDTNNLPEKEEQPTDNLLEFESGLHQLIADELISKETDAQAENVPDDNGMEFVFDASAEPVQEPASEEHKEIKSIQSLDTLLDLAKTYLGMEDVESALQSLNEVVEHGTAAQKKAAKRMIADIKLMK